MQQHMHYYVKHATDISTQYNQHCNSDPWYGASHGAGNTCLHWVVQANSMILAYESMVIPGVVTSPNHSKHFMQLIDAFINDTSLISEQQEWHQNFCNLLADLQQNLNLWHGLLQASGRVLNPSKCIWLCYTWKFAPNGMVHIVPQSTTNHPSQSSSFSHKRCIDIWAST